MDDMERAEHESEQHLSIALKNARSKNKAVIFTGFCKYCAEKIKAGAFCNEWCSSDFEEEQVIKKRQGRI